MRKVKLLLYFVCKKIGLFHLAQWLTRDQLKILCYHGFALADEASFRPKLFIKPEQFEQRLAAIRRCGLRVLPLDEAVERLYSGKLPEHAVVITIDDGFHSVHQFASPCLSRYGYPATVYVTTYYVEKANPIFRLTVQYMFWKTCKQRVELNNSPWSTYRVVDLTDPKQSSQAMWDCINYGERECTEEGRCVICEDLGELLETPYADIVRSKILHLMTPDELRSLAAATIDVELHTHRHVFPNDDQATAKREITDNQAALRRFGISDARHFCYPDGLSDERQWVWLDSLDVKSSTTCVPGLNSRRTPRHALRRFVDSESIHQLEFEAALSGFSDLLRGRRADS